VNGVLTLDAALALLLAVLLIRYLPPKVLGATLLGYLGSLVLIVVFVWLDLDKLALTFGLVASLAALYGIPWLMRDQVLAYPAFRALLGGAPDSDDLEVRQALVAAFFLIVATIVGAYVVNGSVLVFEIAEQVIDEGAPG
jgi:hypothetical protein